MRERERERERERCRDASREKRLEKHTRRVPLVCAVRWLNDGNFATKCS